MRASRLSILSLWVDAMKLDAGLFDAESPVDFDCVAVASLIPGSDLGSHLVDRANAACQTLARERAEFVLGHVQPASMLGCVVDFETLGQPLSFGKRKRLVERTDAMGIQVVHHQDNQLGLG